MSCFLQNVPFSQNPTFLWHFSFPEACVILPYSIAVSRVVSRDLVLLRRAGSGPKTKLFELHALAFRAGQKSKRRL